MKPGQIRPLYLESRLHKQSVKQEINNPGTCLADSIFVTDCLFTSPSSKPFTRFEF
jgi:hypothetical protein